jgi:hypothetical protein
LTVNFAVAEGLIFKEQDLRINLAAQEDELVRSFQQVPAAAGYVTPETADFALPKANANA